MERLLVVSGGDYAALEFKNKYDPDNMSGKEIRELVNLHLKGKTDFA